MLGFETAQWSGVVGAVRIGKGRASAEAPAELCPNSVPPPILYTNSSATPGYTQLPQSEGSGQESEGLG